MRIVVANCSAVYTGRGDTKLKPGIRAILFKEDGAISIHNDAGNKPLNYMGKGNIFTESYEDGVLVWQFDTRKENLTILMHHVLSDTGFEMDLDDEGLIRDGTEVHLQEWLAANPEVLGEGLTLVGREYQTGDGPVDLLMRDDNGEHIAVEVKRVAMLGSVDQIGRYVNALMDDENFGYVRGMIAALDVRPKTQQLADKRGVTCITVDSAWKERKKEAEEMAGQLIVAE